uniref:Uncharacterized protein n=1 Tax=Vespula pensylvanica TaxID=30213 RepID=A0A834P2J7_VESPE|nr:hypothetical protein H0235_008174 [Vespula pensylvanica]
MVMAVMVVVRDGGGCDSGGRTELSFCWDQVQGLGWLLDINFWNLVKSKPVESECLICKIFGLWFNMEKSRDCRVDVQRNPVVTLTNDDDNNKGQDRMLYGPEANQSRESPCSGHSDKEEGVALNAIPLKRLTSDKTYR